MLNLERFFEMSTNYLRLHGSSLYVPPLPSAIYLLQQDVINNYKHASGYTDRSLRDSKDRFDAFNVNARDLIRYTSRLFHITKGRHLESTNQFEALRLESNYFIELAHEEPPIGFIFDMIEQTITAKSPVKPSDEDTPIQYNYTSYDMREPYKEHESERLKADMLMEMTSLELRFREFEEECKRWYTGREAITQFSDIGFGCNIWTY